VSQNLRGSTAAVGDSEVGEGIRCVAQSFAATVGDGGEAVAEEIAGTEGIRKHEDGPQSRLRARLKEPFSASIFF
jgi:hypothetical protein